MTDLKTATTVAQKPHSEPPRRGRPVNEALVPHILQIAGDLFLDLGYAGTTMDAVARAASVSKLTLYKRFQTKEDLFTAVIHHKCDQFIPDALFERLDGMAVDDALFALGSGLLRLLNSREAMSIEVILRSDDEHQKLRDLFYNAGPGRMKSAMAAYFARLDARGLISIDDPMTATHLFAALFKGSDIHMRCGMSIGPLPSTEEIDAYCKYAVDFFLRGCGGTDVSRTTA